MSNAILGNLRHDLSVNSWTSSQPIKRQRHNGISETAPILTDLPNETIFHIMSNLDAHALKNIRKASKKLFYLTETFVGYEIRKTLDRIKLTFLAQNSLLFPCKEGVLISI